MGLSDCGLIGTNITFFREMSKKNIRTVRKDKGLSQEELALESELDRSYVGRVERGERNLSVFNICKLAKTLKVKPGCFFEDIDLSEIK